MIDQILPSIVLKPGREKSVLRRHPWIFSGAIQEIVGDPKNGDLVEVYTAKNVFLGYSAYSHYSQIKCRFWKFTNNKTELNITKLLENRIQLSAQLRHKLFSSKEINAYRLVHGESDQIPGLIVDLYGTTAVMQLLSCGVEAQRETIAEILLGLPKINSVYERSDAEVRSLEGLETRSGHVLGEVVEKIEIIENGVKYLLTTDGGQKTGFYLDQRQNRDRIRQFSKGKDVLDCFCFTGGFSLNAYTGGATSITAVEASEEALDAFRENIELNKMDPGKFELICADVFKQLRLFRDQGRQFDLIILDPPKFAPTRKQVNQASRGYKDINLLAFKLLSPGGVLFTFSCSGGIDSSLFQKIVAGAAVDAEVDARILYRMTQDADHPVLLSFPEGEYLKGFVCMKK